MARPGSGNPELNNFVAEALLKRNKSYDELKNLLRECRKRVEQEPNSEEAVLQLCTLIGSMTANVSAIRERKHEAVVSDILGIKLWNAAPAVLSSVLDFTRNLVVANSAFTHTCLQLIVYSFTPPPAPPNPADPSQDPHGPWRPSEQALAVHEALHSVLSRVMGLVPTAPTNMLPLIVAQMPHKLRDRNTQCLYLSALFRIAEDRAGTPIREALLTAVVEHLLSLDIEIRWEDIVDVPTGEEEEEQDDGANEDIFELEGMLASELDINAAPEELAQRQAMLALRQGGAGDGRGGWEGAVTGAHGGAAAAAAAAGGGGQPQASPRAPVDEMANKMDSMMELAFEHLNRRITSGDFRQLWDTLLSAFERTVLNTHRSKFTQFLLFYACLRHPNHCPAGLVRLLLLRLRDTRQPQITRAACAAYLASFLARAAFLPEALVVKTLQELAAFCVSYCSSVGAGGAGQPGGGGGLHEASPYAGLTNEDSTSATQRHQVLYAAVQAVMYVLCYHMQPLVGSLNLHQGGGGKVAAAAAAAAAPAAAAAGAADAAAGGERRARAEAVVALVRGPVWQVLNHPLQPLRVCLPSVAAEFAHQAASLGIVDCRPLLAQVEPSGRSQRPLEMFFPFDPYLLRRSSRFLQLKTSYVRWRHGQPQAAAGAAGADAAGSESEEDEPAGARSGSEDEDQELSSSSSELEEDDADSDDEGDLAGRSVPSDAVLYDPTHRLHGGGAHPSQQQHHHHHHHHHHHQHHPVPHPMAAHAGGGHHRHGHGNHSLARAAVLGTSYMSYASAETASHGDGANSPYGMSPHDAGDMLVQNPLGASPGAEAMSLGTPEMKYMSQVPMRIGRR